MALAPFPAHRPRRLRTRPAVRALVREHQLHASDLIQPVFFHAGHEDIPITSMPGVARLGLPGLFATAARAVALGVPGLALFPKVGDEEKSEEGEAAWDDRGLVPRTVRALKAAHPDLLVITDVALDPYSVHGQDGVVVDGRIDNDRTLAALCRQAVCQARAGADIVAPSDMMDGRVGALRAALDEHGFDDVLILSYAAKYASCLYGPFREALDSAPRGGTDKRTYQMDPANGDEALKEVELDLSEGADMVMVKPGGPYLDLVWRVKTAFGRPTLAYQVSGEYAMIEAAAARGMIDRKAAILESLIGFRRAGADAILTYWALEVAEWLA